jgi:hypothetical protein
MRLTSGHHRRIAGGSADTLANKEGNLNTTTTHVCPRTLYETYRIMAGTQNAGWTSVECKRTHSEKDGNSLWVYGNTRFHLNFYPLLKKLYFR